MCLCGMLAAEYQTLPEPMRDAVIGFFDENEAWVGAVLADGRDDGSLAFDGRSARGGSTDRQRARGRDAGGTPVRRRRALRTGGGALAGRLLRGAMSEHPPETARHYGRYYGNFANRRLQRDPQSGVRRGSRTEQLADARRARALRRPAGARAGSSAARRRLRHGRPLRAPRAGDRLRRHGHRPRGERPRRTGGASRARPASRRGRASRESTPAGDCPSPEARSTRSSASTRSTTSRVARRCSPTGRACSSRAAGCSSPTP